MAKSKRTELKSAAGAFGDEGVDNNVIISTGAVPQGIGTEEKHTIPLTIDSNGNPEMNVVIKPGASGDYLTVGLTHEGNHIRDAQTVASDAQPSMTVETTETNAFLAMVAAAQECKWPGLVVAGRLIWHSSWSEKEQKTRPLIEIKKLLHESPLYSSRLKEITFRK